MIRPKYDTLWKGVLEEVMKDLLLFVDPNVEKELDLERGFQFLDKELTELCPEPEKPAHTRVVDKLVKVFLRNGSERWMLLHIEVQGKSSKEFPLRMFEYFARLFIKYRQPVAAIAVLTGKVSNKRQGVFEERYLWSHTLYEYKTMCIADYSDEELLASMNPFAAVVMVAKQVLLNAKGTEKERDNILFEQKISMVKLLKERMAVFGEKKTRAIMVFLNNYVVFNTSEINRKFTTRTDEIFQIKNTMGIFEQLAEIKHQEGLQQGVQQGIREGLEQAVKSMLSNTKFSPKEIAEMVGVPLSMVRKLKSELTKK